VANEFGDYVVCSAAHSRFLNDGDRYIRELGHPAGRRLLGGGGQDLEEFRKIKRFPERASNIRAITELAVTLVASGDERIPEVSLVSGSE
jgi:hypothetical protein